MSGRLQSVKGMRDLLPPESAVWEAVEAVARRVFAAYGYDEIRTPLVEETELFVRSVGETTDIVGKEMYSFADKKGRNLTLRPESTAAVARAVIEHGLANRPLPLRLFYIGPHFRYERPQKGRYRQFHQIGAELVGDAGPWGDAELLVMLVRFLGELGYSGLVVLLNTVGDEESRGAYRERLRAWLEPHRDRLGPDSRRRLEENPLRILDTKVAAERELLAGAPRLEESLNEPSRAHFDGLRRALDRIGLAYRVEPRLVRGLDYYSHAVFEIVSEALGAQDAIVGGGRYDGLVRQLGGPDLPGTGFAIGQDRLLEALPEDSPCRRPRRRPVPVVPVGEVDPLEALALAEELRAAGVAATAELTGRSVRAALKRADRDGAAFAVLLGDQELAAGEATLRDLAAGEQSRVARGELAARLGGGR